MHTNALEDTPATTLPCAGGLLAGTLALMTCWAAPEPSTTTSEDQQRQLMARKIASNLFFLREHPDIGPGMRQVIGKVHRRWVLLAHGQSVNNTAAIEPTRATHADALNSLH